MSDKTGIEWTDSTWNPLRGCTRVSEGCVNCYAEGIAARFSDKGQAYEGLAKMQGGKPRWTGELRFIESALDAPLRWKRPRKIFVNSMSDLFHEKAPDEWIDRIFGVMALSPQHTFQILTKRPERMRAWFSERWQPAPAQRYEFGSDVIDMPAETEGMDRHSKVDEAIEEVLRDLRLEDRFVDPDNEDHWTAEGSAKCRQFSWPLPNIWLGVSVEDQATADERIPLLLQTPAAIRFVSYEPALGPVDFRRLKTHGGWYDALAGWRDLRESPALEGVLDWIIAGGESGPNARPAHPDWFRSVRDQCAAAGTALFFKQWGEWAPAPDPAGDSWKAFRARGATNLHSWGADAVERVGKKRAGRLLDGVEHSGFPSISEAREAA